MLVKYFLVKMASLQSLTILKMLLIKNVLLDLKIVSIQMINFFWIQLEPDNATLQPNEI